MSSIVRNIRVKEYLTIKEASRWLSKLMNKKITPSNISYLIQYGRINKYKENGLVVVKKSELLSYYREFFDKRKIEWKRQLGEDLNWALSFDHVPERERTKHVHRLHPYKGKFIPQLVEYFLDEHTDNFKKQVYFHKGDIVLDPFVGSGTTLVQANELGIHAIGIDISAFNCLISNVKVTKVSFYNLHKVISTLTQKLKNFVAQHKNLLFEEELNAKLNAFNEQYFPSPDFKIKVRRGEIDEFEYGRQKLKDFMPIYRSLVQKYKIKVREENAVSFMERWFTVPVRKELEFMREQILKIEDTKIRNVLIVILSRTARSCRATTHSDLATLREPVYEPYYCKKHGKICKPLFSILTWWNRYTKDTLKRLAEFDRLRTDTFQIALQGDARTIDILAELEIHHPQLAKLVKEKKIRGIFTSPPYVGLIDYHEQHAYAYELFGFKRMDELEIGPLFKGQGAEARREYVIGIAQALLNVKRFLQKDYDIFIVANDKFNLYPLIAEKAGMQIVQEFKRPVLNRVEKDRGAYAEKIFHLKEKS